MLTGAVRPGEAVAGGGFAALREAAEDAPLTLDRAVGGGGSGGAFSFLVSGVGDSDGSGLSPGDSSGLADGDGSGVSSGVAAAAGLGCGDFEALARGEALDLGAGVGECFLVEVVFFFFLGAGVGVGVPVKNCFTFP